MARNWAEIGISWSTEQVKKDDTTFDGAEIPNVVDLEKFLASHTNVGDLLNSSNSIRVGSQSVNRAKLPKLTRVMTDGHLPEPAREELREAVYTSAILGVRAAPVVVREVVKIVRMLPDGTTYDGDNKIEYQQLYTSKLVDAGVAANVARGIALKLDW